MAKDTRIARPYGAYNDGSYRQYTNLNSGVDMLGGNALSEGSASLMNSLIQVQQQENLAEQERQDKFSEMVSYSLKDVKSRWRDEGVTKRQKYVDDTTKMAIENKDRPGQFNWEQTKKIEQGKAELDNFVGMSKEMEEWYDDAWKKAILIDDPAAKKRTLNNITAIMDKPTLQDAYDEISDMKWYDGGTGKNADAGTWYKDRFKEMPPLTMKNGVIDKEPVRIASLASLKAGDDKAITYYENYKTHTKNPDVTHEEYANIEASRAALYATAAKDNEGKAGKDGTVDNPWVLEAGKNDGIYRVGGLNGGKGVQLGGVKAKDKDGNEVYHDGAQIQEVRPRTDGVGYEVVITHDIFKTENALEQRAMIAETLGEDLAALFIATAQAGNIKQSADQVQKGEVVLAYEDIAPILKANHVILKGIDLDEPTQQEQGGADNNKGILEILNGGN